MDFDLHNPDLEDENQQELQDRLLDPLTTPSNETSTATIVGGTSAEGDQPDNKANCGVLVLLLLQKNIVNPSRG